MEKLPSVRPKVPQYSFPSTSKTLLADGSDQHFGSEDDEKDRQKSRSRTVPVEDVDGPVDLENLSSLINNGSLQHLSKLASWAVQEVVHNIEF